MSLSGTRTFLTAVVTHRGAVVTLPASTRRRPAASSRLTGPAGHRLPSSPGPLHPLSPRPLRRGPGSAVPGGVGWAGGPSYGLGSRPSGGARPPAVRHYSLLSPGGSSVATTPRGSVVTFDIGQPGVRRHSSRAVRLHARRGVLRAVA